MIKQKEITSNRLEQLNPENVIPSNTVLILSKFPTMGMCYCLLLKKNHHLDWKQQQPKKGKWKEVALAGGIRRGFGCRVLAHPLSMRNSISFPRLRFLTCKMWKEIQLVSLFELMWRSSNYCQQRGWSQKQLEVWNVTFLLQSSRDNVLSGPRVQLVVASNWRGSKVHRNALR